MFKIKRRTNKIIRGALFLLALLFSFHITVKQVIHAKTIPNVITSMKVTDSDGNPLQGDLKKWQDFKVSATFSLPNNTVAAGDTTTIDFPKQLVYNSPNKSFNIVSSQGDIVAVANIDATKKLFLLIRIMLKNIRILKGHLIFMFVLIIASIKSTEKLI